MKKLTIFTITLLAGCLAAAVPAYAAQEKAKEPSEATMSQAELNGYTEEQWSALTDSRIEFSEIKDLVHNFNPTMAQYWDAYDDSVRSVKYSADIMREAKSEAVDTYDQYKNNPYLSPEMKAQLKSIVTLTSTMLRTYNDTYAGLNKNSSSNKQLRQAEDQITNGVQQMMIGYKTIESNVKLLKKLVELNEASVAAYESMKANGMATETDVLSAQAGLISAQSNLASLEATQKQLYGQLLTMCGRNADEDIIIGDIPETEKARIEAMDPEKDFEKAAGNNTALISLRSEKRNKNQGLVDTMDAYYDYMKDSLRIKLDTLYAAVQGAQYAYDAAKAGYEGAQIQEEAAQKQYKSGMLSEAQYIGAQIQVIQKEAALETAKNNLEQAVLEYEWAVKGYCDIN